MTNLTIRCIDCYQPTYREPEFSLCFACINKALESMLKRKRRDRSEYSNNEGGEND